jgi:hypothetical protein
MSEYDRTNTGIISKNTRKETETHPDIRGSINIEGVDYWLDGWLKERNDGTGKFYSLRAKPKEAQKPAPKKPAASRVPGSDDDLESDIPF